jgi:low affinity Fe/Cu permease
MRILALLLDWSLTWQIRINTSVHNDYYVYHMI